MKSNSKYISSSFILSLSITIPMVITSCSTNSNTSNNIDLYKFPIYTNQTEPDYNLTPNPKKTTTYENIDHIKFISERSFSLKMVSEPIMKNNELVRSIGYGTGWLFAKDNLNKETYYMATNLHVASILFNSGKKSYEYNGKGQYELKENPIFNEIEFGQVITHDASQEDKYVVGTTETNLDYSKTYYTQKVDKSGIEFSYLTFDMFNKMQLKDLFHVYNEPIINNATQDLAILKIDFSKRQYINNSKSPLVNTDPLLKSLKAYDANPTRFAQSEYQDTSNLDITVGGFPYSKRNFDNNSGGEWTTSNYLNENKNIKYDGKMAGSLFNKENWKNNIPTNNIDFIKKNYVINGHIPFITSDYASYSNTSLQLLFSDLDIAGGSSGSMAINNKNEVIGIYWGTYNIFRDGQKKVSGVIDSFISSKENIYNEDNIEILKKYNTISDFVSKVKNTNLEITK